MAINYKTLGDRISKVSLERLVSISEYFNCNIDFFIDGINSNTEHYLAQDFEELYVQLSSHEKNILKILLQEYIHNR